MRENSRESWEANGAGERSKGVAAARQWLADLCHSQRLSPTQRRVAQSYLDTMPDAAFLSTSEAASRAGVSQATVTRFVATLGFAAYADFRSELRDRVLGPASSEASVTEPATPGVDAIAEAQANLESLRSTLDSAAMSSAVALLAEARTLVIVGFRASASLASYTAYFAGRIHDDVRLVTDADTALDTLNQLNLRAIPNRTVALLFAMPRYSASTARTLAFARSLGMTTLLIVDSPLADFTRDADHVLAAQVGTGMIFDSHAAPIVLAVSLIDGMASVRPQRAQERLEAHEALVNTWAHLPDLS